MLLQAVVISAAGMGTDEAGRFIADSAAEFAGEGYPQSLANSAAEAAERARQAAIRIAERAREAASRCTGLKRFTLKGLPSRWQPGQPGRSACWEL